MIAKFIMSGNMLIGHIMDVDGNMNLTHVKDGQRQTSLSPSQTTRMPSGNQ